MSRIGKKFEKLGGKTAFIGYITAGDPSIETTKDLVLAMEKGGCDIIELGVPYSDPVADGPVIQAAAQRALDNGVTVEKIIENGGGFVYCISSFGVTGTRTEFDNTIGSYLKEVKKVSELPLAIGFGISTREDVKTFETLANGVIVGSALVKVVAETNGDTKALENKVRELSGN